MSEKMHYNNTMIQVTNLVKRYGDLPAVDDISFTVRKGEIFAFLGPNGAGKTTTIKMLTTLLLPTSGKIIINGYNPVSEQNAVRRSFGIVFQDPSLDNELTAYENMLFHAILYNMPKNIRNKRIKELLEMLQLWERKDELVKNFSGGMKRRLEIARGLLHLPQILFLDEPTLGLDPQTRNLLWEQIKELNKKEQITVFLTTHIMEEAERVADTVAVIDYGRIIAMGSPEELTQQTGTSSLEEAFLVLTGKTIREKENEDHRRIFKRMLSRRR